MGISYWAVKVSVPQALEIGKDYYGLTDLFPPCAYESKLFPARAKIEDLPHLIGSRHIVGSKPFMIAELYNTLDELVSRAEALKKRSLHAFEVEIMRAFFDWAGRDFVQFIADFDQLPERGKAHEYHLCTAPENYIKIRVRMVHETGGRDESED